MKKLVVRNIKYCFNDCPFCEYDYDNDTYWCMLIDIALGTRKDYKSHTPRHISIPNDCPLEDEDDNCS